jgi:Tfp pilus assembly PilM family ATPase
MLSSRARAQGVQRDATALLTACGLALRSFD